MYNLFVCTSRVLYYKSNEPLLAQFSSSLFWCRDEERPAIAAVDIRNESLQAGVVERLVFTSQGMVRADVGRVHQIAIPFLNSAISSAKWRWRARHLKPVSPSSSNSLGYLPP